MHPVHDSDVLLLIATTLSSKKKPASLVEIIAAMDLLNDAVPPENKLADAFARLGAHGLLSQVDDAFALTPAAEDIMATQPRKADMGEHVFSLRQKLADYLPKAPGASIVVSAEAIAAAMKTHAAAARGVGKHLLMPIRSKETENKRAAPRRRPPSRK